MKNFKYLMDSPPPPTADVIGLRRTRGPSGVHLLWLVTLILNFSVARADLFDRRSDTRTSTTEQIANQRQHWGLDLDLGINTARGNIDNTLATSQLKTFQNFGEFNIYISGGYQYLRVDQDRIQNRANGIFRMDYRLSNQWRVFAFSTHAFNEFLKIDYRTGNGIGPWFDAIQGPTRLAISVAIAHEFENFYDAPSARTIRSPLRQILEFQVTDTAQIGVDFFYSPAVKDFGDYHIFAEPFIESKVYRDKVGLKYRLTFERDNRPPPGVDQNDLAMSVALSIHLGK